jgi:hypothetical protein
MNNEWVAHAMKRLDVDPDRRSRRFERKASF